LEDFLLGLGWCFVIVIVGGGSVVVHSEAVAL
jgi:hypothetical protein